MRTCDLAQDPPHNFAAPRLREARRPVDDVGGGEGADLRAHGCHQLLADGIRGLRPLHQRDVGVDALPLDVVVVPHHRRLHAFVVRHQRALDLSGSDAVPADVDDVIHSPRDPIVPVRVPPAPVPREVVSREGAEVRLLVSQMVVENRAHHGRPGGLDGKQPLGRPLELLSLLVEHGGLHTKEREGGGARLLTPPAGQRGDEDTSGLRLPPRVHDRAPPLPHHLVVPPPGLRVDGLTHRPQEAQGLAARPRHEVVALFLKGAYRGGCSVERRHLVLVDNVPEAPGVREGGNAFKHHVGGPVEEGAVGEVGVPGDPPAVRGAEEDVAVAMVEDVFERGGRIDHVPRSGVHDSLRRARGPAGIQHKERVLGVHPLDRAGGGLPRQGLVP
mmetsp:Transcript_2113/g.7553  ORF Transcript_2113/g.7553 Transcript_2113/m.7553 type:complete len:387 (-) Transcript_2113:1045-2205(-)